MPITGKAKTCWRCRALRYAPGEDPSCLLGHPIDPKAEAPMEPCEKPRTYLDFIEARRDFIAERNT